MSFGVRSLTQAVIPDPQTWYNAFKATLRSEVMKWLIERLVQRLREQLIAQNTFEDSLGRWRLIQKSNGSCSALRRSLRLPLVVTVVVGTKGDNVARNYLTNGICRPQKLACLWAFKRHRGLHHTGAAPL